MQGWLPLCCGDNWDLFTVKRKWIFTITARSRYRCSASPASISRIFSRKKLSYCMLKDMSFWNPIYVVLHSGFKLLKPAEKKFTWRNFTRKFQAFKRSTSCMRYAENSKFVKTVVDMSMIYQFNEFFDLIFGGFFAICPKCVLCEAVTHHWLLSTSKPTPDKTNGGLRRFIFHNVSKNVLKSPKTLNTLIIWQDLF